MRSACEARSVDQLVRAVARGEHPQFLHFWGHRPRPGQPLGRECLSQWWPAPFTIDGIHFASAEHFMMWSKARLFGDEATADRVLDASTPAEAKALGRAVSGFDHEAWQEHRWDIVVQGSVAKFASDPMLRAYLLSTGDAVLVEAAPNDRVWGIGLAADDPRAQDPASWLGLNLLGFALMEARSHLAADACDFSHSGSARQPANDPKGEPLTGERHGLN